MFKVKRYTSLFILLLLVLILSACGDSTPAPTPTTVAAPTPVAEATPDTSTEALKLLKGSMGSMGEDSGDTTTYKVVVNDEEQYSIWPANRELPLGWRDVGKVG